MNQQTTQQPPNGLRWHFRLDDGKNGVMEGSIYAPEIRDAVKAVLSDIQVLNFALVRNVDAVALLHAGTSPDARSHNASHGGASLAVKAEPVWGAPGSISHGARVALRADEAFERHVFEEDHSVRVRFAQPWESILGPDPKEGPYRFMRRGVFGQATSDKDDPYRQWNFIVAFDLTDEVMAVNALRVRT